MSDGKKPRPTRALLALFCLTAVVLADRLAGLDWMLPHLPEPDRHLTHQLGFQWGGGSPWSAPRQFYFYPTLISRTLALTPPPRAPGDPDLHGQLRAAGEGVLRVRWVAALAGALAIPLTYALARHFLQPWPSFFAAALLATSYLFNLLSLQARPHAMVACASLAAVLACMALRQRPTFAAYFVAGSLTAIAIGCLQNGAFILPSLLCAHLLSGRGRRSLLKALVPIGLIIASLLSFYPFLASELGEADAPHEFTDYTVRDGAIELGNQRLLLERFDGSAFGRIVDYLLWNDPLLLALCSLGLAIGIPALWMRWRKLSVERRADLVIVLAYAVPHYLVLGSYRHTWGRFLVPMLPYAALLASFAATTALGWAASRVVPPRWRPPFIATGALLLVAFPAYAWFRFGVLRRRPDTLEQAAAWIQSHAQRESDTVLVQRALDLPLYSTPESLSASEANYPRSSYAPDSHRKWSMHQTRLDPSLASDQGWKLVYTPWQQRRRKELADPARAQQFLDEMAPRYAVIEDSSRTSILPEEASLLEAVRKSGELVARFQPRPFTEPHFEWMDYQDARFAVLRTLRSSCFGPLIEIYALR